MWHLFNILKNNIYCKACYNKVFSRDNIEWDFYRFEKKINKNLLCEHNGILMWAEKMALYQNLNEENALYKNAIDPIVKQGFALKVKNLHAFENKYKNYKGLRILVHVPDPIISPAGNSLFNNWIDGLRVLGIPVKALFFNEYIEKELELFQPTIFLTSDSYQYISRINWEAILQYKKTHTLKIGITAAFGNVDGKDFAERILWAKRNNIDFYYCYDDLSYCAEAYKCFTEEGYMVFGIPFGVNPLKYYPIPNIKRDIEYVFLGSINRDKWNRYVEYFSNIFQNKNGFLSGPGWANIQVNNINPDRDRYIYARAKVGLNLHLDYQINKINQLNERTYMLAACGVPQLIDNPAILLKYFEEDCFFIGTNSFEYNMKYKEILDDPEEAMKRALKAQKTVFEQHTIFHRMEKFILELTEFIK